MPGFVRKPASRTTAQPTHGTAVAGVPGKLTLTSQRMAPTPNARTSAPASADTPAAPDDRALIRAQYRTLVASARVGLMAPAQAVEAFAKFDRDHHGGQPSPMGVELLARMPFDIASRSGTEVEGHEPARPPSRSEDRSRASTTPSPSPSPQPTAPAAGAGLGYASWRTLGYTLEHSAIQLRLASTYLADWKLNHHLGAAIHWVEKHHEVVADTPDSTLRAWTPYIVRQSDALFDADGDISIILKLAESRHVRPDAPEAAPFRDVLEKYAVAIGEAHVSEDPQILLDAARRAKRLLPSALLDQTLRTHRALTLEMMATVPDVADAHGMRQVDNARTTMYTLEDQANELRHSHRADGNLDVAAIDDAELSAEEQIVVVRTLTLEEKIRQFASAAAKSTEGVIEGNSNLLNHEIRDVTHALYAMLPELTRIAPEMRHEAIPEGPFPADPAAGQRMFAQARRRAVARAKASLAKLAEEHQLQALFKRTLASIEHAQRNTRIGHLVVDIAALIGISVVTAGVADLAAGATRGAFVMEGAADTEEFARAARLARGAGAVTRFATEVGLQSGGQMLVDGNTSFAEASLSNALTLGALRPFHSLVGRIGQLDADAHGLWKAISGGKVVLVSGAKLTVETLVGAGASYVAKLAVEGKPPPNDPTAVMWAMQGASIVVGKFIHGKMFELQNRWGHIAEEKVALLGRARKQAQLAEAVQQTGNTEAALHVLEEHARILQDEFVLLRDPAALARLHLDPQQLRVLRLGNTEALAETQGQAFGFMRLRFLGLEPMTSTGDVWSGTRTQIDALIADAGGAARDFTATGNGEWTARMAGQNVKFVEVSHWGIDAKDIKRVPQKGDDGHEYQYDAMHPGPLSDRSVYDPGDPSNPLPLPAQNFYGGKYNEVLVANDTVFYRLGNAAKEWGEWFTDHPLDSEAQYRLDLGVKREWSNPRTGTVLTGRTRGVQELELWSYSILIPKGTTIYVGQSGTQGGPFMGGLGPGSQQYFIPKAWELAQKGARVIAKARFTRAGSPL